MLSGSIPVRKDGRLAARAHTRERRMRQSAVTVSGSYPASRLDVTVRMPTPARTVPIKVMLLNTKPTLVSIRSRALAGVSSSPAACHLSSSGPGGRPLRTRKPNWRCYSQARRLSNHSQGRWQSWSSSSRENILVALVAGHLERPALLAVLHVEVGHITGVVLLP